MSISEKIFMDEGSLATKLDGYKVRPQQIEMARSVEEAIENSRNLIVEAGTGVGKSLAYLVPLVNMAMDRGIKVVISTYTKALQNQLFVKDMPLVSAILGRDIKYALCMGSDNYVCLKKAARAAVPELFETVAKAGQVKMVAEWLERTESGLSTDMDFLPERSVWDKFSREGDLCRGRRCHEYGSCFYMKARRQQAAAHILIANHALVLTDMISESSILPEYGALVVDEAHTLEDAATNHFGRRVGAGRIETILSGLENFLKQAGWGKGFSGELTEVLSSIGEGIEKARRELAGFTGKVEKLFPVAQNVIVLGEEYSFQGGLSGALAALGHDLGKAGVMAGECEEAYDALSFSKRLSMAADDLDFIFLRDNQEYVYWTELRKRRGKNVRVFKAAPVDVGPMLRSGLFDHVSPVVMTSATLVSDSKRKDFSYFKARVGMTDALEVVLDSPFDYRNNVLMYIPERAIDPNKSQKDFREHVFNNIVDIYGIMGGRMFGLFTSYDMMNDITSRVREKHPEIEVRKQGELPRYVLLDVFKRDKGSVLMGTTTFWQGVDVPGSSLECVIISKLPFAVPSDPVTAARINTIRNRGGDPFHEYQLPRAVLMFKQGFGRLIRSHADRGVVAVLDPRVITRRYGREFLAALPECRRTGNIEDIKSFFGKN